MRLAFAALATALLFPLATASAQDCANATDQATMSQCAGKALNDADKQLNADFKEIEKRLADDAGARKQLVAAQRAWIAFRDAECDFQSSGAAGGSIHPMLVANCKAALTNQRLMDFKNYLACEEGDMSCPVPAAE
ncbi:lysozyme inhibitor LprI family protein [Mesorhizobium sp. ASY16-5R]|uniref:lysozyme inhibitor LprI family protein n=1 Tax=Mesorhizobium sp. ASY16-5R TaxID=3445772 RepID=UPI003F9FF026